MCANTRANDPADAEASPLGPTLGSEFTSGFPGSSPASGAAFDDDDVLLSKPYRNQDLARALQEIERSIGLLAFHIERTFTDAEQRYDLAGYLDNLRRAVRKIEEH